MSDVTVILTVYNSAATIEKCINSILNVDYPELNVVVVDAFSNDGTFEILSKYKSKISLFQKKGNAAVGFNECISHVNTPFTAFTDSDCVVETDWITELRRGFVNKDVIATSGFCSTPKDVNLLSKLIGYELEQRFKNAPEYVTRSPTMNLMVKTDILKKEKFKENLNIAFETELVYRLSKLGKIRFIPKARIYHYHRTSLGSFFKQQKNYMKYAVKFYFSREFVTMIKGDHITTSNMLLQIIFFNVFGITILLYLIFRSTFSYLMGITFIILMVTYLINIIKTGLKSPQSLFYFPLLLFRNIAWDIGFIEGIFF